MTNISPKQNKILEFLLEKNDGATLEEICAHLEVTKTAAKEQIIKMDHLGYIYFQDSKGSVGRPKRSYFLTEQGHEVFPKQYSWLSNVLLEHLSNDLGSAMVTKIMKELGSSVAKSMKDRFKNKSTPELLKEINSALNELGYRSSLKQSDIRKGAILEATNCVYHSVAKAHPELCQFDVEFLRTASNMNVKLEACIARGGSICRFCISK